MNSQFPKHIILIDCPDEKGLVYKITDILYKLDLNIENNLEFVEKESGHFFMRTEVSGLVDPAEMKSRLLEILPKSVKITFNQPGKKKIVVFASKEYHCLGDLIGRYHFDQINADILAVISNHQILKDFTEKFEIPFHFLPHQDVSRVDHEGQVLEVLKNYDFDYLVLAKYMRILSPDFVAQFPNQIINIHHSFLPAFIGANPYRQAYNRGVKVIGATAHFVTDNLDEGPIIAQDVLPVNHSLGVKEMALAGKDVEKIVLAKALKMVLEDRCFTFGNRTIVLT